MKISDFKSDLINNPVLENGTIAGEIHFPTLKKNLVVEIDPELANPIIDDFNQLVDKLRRLIKQLNADSYNVILQNIAEEAVNVLFEQEGYNTGPEERKALKRNLDLGGITVFPEGFLLVFLTEKFFPDYQLVAELTNDLEIYDIALHD